MSVFAPVKHRRKYINLKFNNHIKKTFKLNIACVRYKNFAFIAFIFFYIFYSPFSKCSKEIPFGQFTLDLKKKLKEFKNCSQRKNKYVFTVQRIEFNCEEIQRFKNRSSPQRFPANNMTNRTMYRRPDSNRFKAVLNICFRCHSSLRIHVILWACVWNRSRIRDYVWAHHLQAIWVTDGIFIFFSISPSLLPYIFILSFV